MGIGVVLLTWLLLGIAVLVPAALGIVFARRIRGRRLRIAVRLALGLFACAGLAPFASTMMLALFPHSHPNPEHALSEIFPAPLPSGIKALEAYGDDSSDYWSLYVAFQTDRKDLEFLRAARGLAPLTASYDRSFRLPTNVQSPEFWPSGCDGLEVYDRRGGLAPPRTWDQIRLFYCPATEMAYVWAVDVD